MSYKRILAAIISSLLYSRLCNRFSTFYTYAKYNKNLDYFVFKEHHYRDALMLLILNADQFQLSSLKLI